jgi:hypothetical protein
MSRALQKLHDLRHRNHGDKTDDHENDEHFHKRETTLTSSARKIIYLSDFGILRNLSA